MIKMIAIDLDGTLLDDQKQFDQEKFSYLYKLNKIITLHFHAETVNDNLPLLVYPSEETLNRQIDLLDA